LTTTINATIGGYNFGGAAKRIDIWHEGGGVGRWELYVDNSSDGSEIITTHYEATDLGINGTTLMKGRVDDVAPMNNDETAVNSKYVKINGRNYGADLAKKFIIVKYADTKFDDLVADALSQVSTEITYTSPSTAAVIDFAFNKSYLLNGFSEIAQKIGYDYVVKNDKTFDLWALSNAPSSGVTLKSVSEAADNNILAIDPETRTGVDIYNYVRVDAGKLVDDWTEGNASDYTVSNCTASDESTIMVYGSQSIKATVVSSAYCYLYIQFPKYNYTTLDLSNIPSANLTIWFYGEPYHTILADPTVELYLKDTAGNEIRCPFKVSINKWTELTTKVGSSTELDQNANLGKWYNITGTTFNWDITRMGVWLNTDTDFFIDGLQLDCIDVYAIAQDSTSITSYGTCMLPLNRTDIKSQVQLQATADAELANRKDPINKLKLTCTFQPTLLYAGYLVTVLAPNDNIGSGSTGVVYRILNIHHIAEPGVNLCRNHDAITILELIKHDGGAGVDPTRFKLASTNPQSAINIRVDSRIRVLESSLSTTGIAASGGGGGYIGSGIGELSAYVIRKSGSNYYALNLQTGVIDFSSTDFADVLQAAINAAIGDVLIGDNDTYTLADGIDMVSGISIKLSSCAKIVKAFNGDMFTFSNIQRSYLIGGTLDGASSSYTGSGVVIDGGSTICGVIDSYIINQYDNAVLIDGATTKHNVVNNIHAYNIGNEGICVDKGTDNFIQGSTVATTGFHGILITGGSRNHIISNIVWSAGYLNTGSGRYASTFAHGIAVDGNAGSNPAYDNEVIGNNIYNTLMAGIEVADSAHCTTIQGNIVRNTGVASTSGYAPTDGSGQTGLNTYGIYIGGYYAPSHYCRVIGNHVAGVKRERAIWICGQATGNRIKFFAVEGNTIEGIKTTWPAVTLDGIYIRHAEHGTIANNNVYNCYGYGLAFDTSEADYIQIYGNNYNGNGHDSAFWQGGNLHGGMLEYGATDGSISTGPNLIIAGYIQEIYQNSIGNGKDYIAIKRADLSSYEPVFWLHEEDKSGGGSTDQITHLQIRGPIHAYIDKDVSSDTFFTPYIDLADANWSWTMGLGASGNSSSDNTWVYFAWVYGSGSYTEEARIDKTGMLQLRSGITTLLGGSCNVPTNIVPLYLSVQSGHAASIIQAVLGVNTMFTLGQYGNLTVNTQSTGVVPYYADTPTGQTANLLELRVNSTPKAYIDKDGNMTITGKLTQSGCLPRDAPREDVLMYLDATQNEGQHETQTEVDALTRIILDHEAKISSLQNNDVKQANPQIKTSKKSDQPRIIAKLKSLLKI
jgi:hypothetical protein